MKDKIETIQQWRELHEENLITAEMDLDELYVYIMRQREGLCEECQEELESFENEGLCSSCCYLKYKI